ncbi:MAG: ROK family glucokinase [Lachnospiraceae bacterium]|nr:ROK family glucokinase [Lachnospiraceae bacterium]
MEKIDDHKYCFGVDIGGTTVKLGMFDALGDVLSKWEIKTRTENNGANIISDVCDSIKKKMGEKNIDPKDVMGVGVGAPGPVRKDGTIFGAVNLGWGVINMKKEFESLLNMPVVAGNDANVAALGEMWKGGGKGYDNLILVTLGTGVGGGIIIDEKILTGAKGAGGEIGHIHINDEESEACGCGNKGCLEQYASATGIARLARKRLEASDKDSILRGKEINAKTVFDAVKAGDPLAMEVAEEFGNYLGKGIAAISCVTNPDVVVIGGGVSKAGSVIIDYIKKYYVKYAFHASVETEFALATLDNDAGIFGAAKMALDNYYEKKESE